MLEGDVTGLTRHTDTPPKRGQTVPTGHNDIQIYRHTHWHGHTGTHSNMETCGQILQIHKHTHLSFSLREDKPMTEQWRKKEQTERTQSTMRLKMNRGCMEGDKRGNESTKGG